MLPGQVRVPGDDPPPFQADPGNDPRSSIEYTAMRPMFNRRAISSTDMRMLGESTNPSALDCPFLAMALLDVIPVSVCGRAG